MSRAKPTRKPAAPMPPRLPPEPPEPPPAWVANFTRDTRSSFDRWRPRGMRLHSFRGGPVYLPPFQRAADAWTPQMQIDYCTALMNGAPTTQLLMVEIGWIETRRHYVIDGQQRLTALGVDIVRHDGTRNPPTAARFNVHTGEWGGSEADGSYSLAEASVFEYDMWRRADDHSRERSRGLGRLNSLIGNIEIPAYTSGYYRPSEAVGRELAAAFASINHPGAPIHPDNLAGLLRFGEGWIPGIDEKETP